MNYQHIIQIIRLASFLDSNEKRQREILRLIREQQPDEQLLHIANIHGLSSLLYHYLSKIPEIRNQHPAFIKSLQQSYFKVLSRSMVLNHAFVQIATKLNEQGIDLIPLKGVYLAETLYKEPGIRQFSDLDILVHEEDANSCVKILEDMGYKMPDKSNSSITQFVDKMQRDIVHLTSLYKDGISVELHIKLHYFSADYNMKITAIWESAMPGMLLGVPVKAMNMYDLLIHLCVHLDKHFSKGQAQYKSYLDIVNLIEVNHEALEWDQLIERCRLHACEKAVFKHIILSVNNFGFSIPEDIYKSYQDACSEQDQKKFIQYFGGDFDEEVNKSAVPAHLTNLKLAGSLQLKLRYLTDIIFPPRRFMLTKYQIKHPALFWLWYPYRWWRGFIGLIKTKKQ